MGVVAGAPAGTLERRTQLDFHLTAFIASKVIEAVSSLLHLIRTGQS